ncbi:MAG: cysteine hydrolase [Rhodospirillaceae bacterium]|nr:cysteine hydrolase [Rhodospirillaceae bacterium]
MSAPLRPLPADTLVVGVDMQRLFAEHPEWGVPGLASILPNLLRLCGHDPRRTLLTRFMPPAAPEQATGTWRRYYERWSSVTLDRAPGSLVELVPELAALAPPAEVCDKTAYSAFSSAAFCVALSRHGADTLVFAGLETDVCVLASVFDAVDRGLRTIVVTDAVTSASARGHDAAIEILATRLDEQVELAATDEVLAAWGG